LFMISENVGLGSSFDALFVGLIFVCDKDYLSHLLICIQDRTQTRLSAKTLSRVKNSSSNNNECIK